MVSEALFWSVSRVLRRPLCSVSASESPRTSSTSLKGRAKFLNHRYAGVLDSFLPFYTFERRLDSWRELMVRAVVGAMLAAAIEQISHEHSFDD